MKKLFASFFVLTLNASLLSGDHKFQQNKPGRIDENSRKTQDHTYSLTSKSKDQLSQDLGTLHIKKLIHAAEADKKYANGEDLNIIPATKDPGSSEELSCTPINTGQRPQTF